VLLVFLGGALLGVGGGLCLNAGANTTAGMAALQALLERHQVSRVGIEDSGTWGRGACRPPGRPGMTFSISSSAAMTHLRALLRTDRFSVQPVAMSVTVSV